MLYSQHHSEVKLTILYTPLVLRDALSSTLQRFAPEDLKLRISIHHRAFVIVGSFCVGVGEGQSKQDFHAEKASLKSSEVPFLQSITCCRLVTITTL